MKNNKRKKTSIETVKKPAKRKWNRELVIEELRKLHKKGCKMLQKEIAQKDKRLVAAACRYYGSWRKALIAADIKPCSAPLSRWTEEKVQREILEMLREGESLKAVDMIKNRPKLYKAACKLFGGCSNAVESLGIIYTKFGKKRFWSEAEFREKLMTLARSGNPLNAKWVLENDHALYYTAANKYGSWEKALESISIDYSEVRLYKKWTPENIVDIVRKMYRNGDRIDSVYVKEHNARLFHAGERYFGTWKKTVIKAGIDYEKYSIDRRKKWSRKIIVEEILDLRRKGMKLNCASARAYSNNLISAAQRHFGSWKAALEEAGIDPLKVAESNKWTQDEVIREIQRLKAEGFDLSLTAVHDRYERLYKAGVSRFGSWEKAISAAGLDYSRIVKVRRWNKGNIMAVLQERLIRGGNMSTNAVRQDDSGLWAAAHHHFGTWPEAVRAARADLDFKEAIRKAGKKSKQTDLKKDMAKKGRKGMITMSISQL